MGLELVIQAIHANRRFSITTHRQPEADAMGSSLALAYILRELGKDCSIVSMDPLPKILKFLPHDGLIIQQDRVSDWPEVFFVLDCGDITRPGLLNGGVPPDCTLVNIDHHITNKNFGRINWVEPEAAATAEMICDLIEGMSMKPSFEVALCLYTAIASETGSFAYSNTQPKTLRTCAALLEHGVDAWYVAQRLREYTPERLDLLSQVLAGLQYSVDDQIAWITVTKDIMKRTGTIAEDTEDLINFPRSLHGIEVALSFREEVDGNIKVSLRSRDSVDVARLATSLGGGGHQRAAGCTLKGKVEEIRERVISAAREAIHSVKR